MGMSTEPIKPDPEKKPKRPRDTNQLAKKIVDLATGEAEEPEESDAAKRGREGGKKGGVSRAEKLTPEQRRKIAQKAAKARWDRGEK